MKYKSCAKMLQIYMYIKRNKRRSELRRRFYRLRAFRPGFTDIRRLVFSSSLQQKGGERERLGIILNQLNFCIRPEDLVDFSTLIILLSSNYCNVFKIYI